MADQLIQICPDLIGFAEDPRVPNRFNFPASSRTLGTSIIPRPRNMLCTLIMGSWDRERIYSERGRSVPRDFQAILHSRVKCAKVHEERVVVRRKKLHFACLEDASNLKAAFNVDPLLLSATHPLR